MEIKAPHLSKENIRTKAEEFLARYNPKRKFPLEIELIAEKQGIKISPLPGLKMATGVEGFIKPDLTEIGIDSDIYFSFENRARFTIAHEVGHWFMHKSIYSKISKEIQLKSFFDYAEFIEEIPAKEYDWIEWQSYFFAGQVLVPGKELKRKLEEVLNSSFIKKVIKDDVVFPVVEELAVVFNVSSQVVRKRIKEDNLIKLTLTDNTVL
jgi:Zn-dependent peptidase ImmA (M78 family)